MISRERVLNAILGKQPDRVPIDIGGLSNLTSLHIDAYKKLLDYLGINEDIVISSFTHQSAAVSPAVRQALHSDTYPIFIPKTPANIIVKPDGSQQFEDEWGSVWKMPKGGFYYDNISSPFNGCCEEDLLNFTVPEACSQEIIRKIKPQAEAAYKAGLFTILNMPVSGSIYALAQSLYGYSDFFVAMMIEPELAHRMINLALEYQLKFFKTAIEELDGLVDAVLLADDLATQTGPLMSPELYYEFVKPAHKKAVDEYLTHGVKTIFHCCGAASSYIPDMADIGFIAWNPVQVSAAGNQDTAKLKADYGDKIVFWGGTCDSQNTLVNGSPDDVRSETKRRIHDLAPGGRFVASSIHNVQRDVPVENMIALYESFYKYGQEVYQ